MWASQQFSTKRVQHSPPESSWRFSRVQRQLLWLGVTCLVLAQCALAMSLPSLSDYAPTLRVSGPQAVASPHTTANVTGSAWTTSTAASESKK